MEDLNSGAPAPAEPSVAPVTEAPVEANIQPEAVKPEPKVAEGDPKPKATSTRDALRAAASKVSETIASEAKAKEDRSRDEQGRFAPKEGEVPVQKAEQQPQPKQVVAKPGVDEPPARFSAEAKAAWATAPDALKHETQRAFQEMERGIEKYRANATAFEDIKEFDELAKASGTTMKAAMANYVGMENLLRRDFASGVELLCKNRGTTLEAFAQAILNMPADAKAQNGQQPADPVINSLNAKIAELERQLGHVSGTIQTSQRSAVQSEIDAFASMPEHSRFDELQDDIVFLIESGRAEDLSEAYRLADRLNPAPAQPQPAAAVIQPAIPAPAKPDIDRQAQTLRGQKSISGAPGPGSNPLTRPPSTSIKESLRRAQALVG